MAASTKTFHFFASPPEIRNRIMGYVLVPGDVYVRSSTSTSQARQPQQSRKFLSSPFRRFMNAASTLSRRVTGHHRRYAINTTEISSIGPPSLQQPGFQLLITCKQAYHEGHLMFYTMNTFHWPLDFFYNSFGWYLHLRPEHLKLIKTICINLSLMDLDHESIKAIEISAKNHPGGRPNNFDGNTWGSVLRPWLRRDLLIKMRSPYFHLEDTSWFVGLERIIVSSRFGQCVLDSLLEYNEDEIELFERIHLCPISRIRERHRGPSWSDRMEEDKKAVGGATQIRNHCLRRSCQGYFRCRS